MEDESKPKPRRLYRSWHFQVGFLLFLAAELWRDLYPPSTWPMILLRFALFIGALLFLGASVEENSK
jgi:hypothetical protein